jgi:hypothetical protein
MNEGGPNRELTSEERRLVGWMLEHGGPDAEKFIPQLERAQVLPTRCPCGCASIDFSMDGRPQPGGGLRAVADFVFDSGDEMSGVFVFEQSGVLAGLEVYGLGGDAPKTLPHPDSLRPFDDETAAPGK